MWPTNPSLNRYLCLHSPFIDKTVIVVICRGISWILLDPPKRWLNIYSSSSSANKSQFFRVNPFRGLLSPAFPLKNILNCSMIASHHDHDLFSSAMRFQFSSQMDLQIPIRSSDQYNPHLGANSGPKYFNGALNSSFGSCRDRGDLISRHGQE